MAITNKFIHFNAKAKFVERFATETDDFKNKYTIFIKDTKQIWAHGGMYGGYYEFASGTDGSFTVTKPKVGIEAGTETVKITIGKPGNAGHADFATNAGHADTADNATHADTASSANTANKVGANLTITNGSNSVTYNGSEAKSITITSGTNYELTADKMSTAWGSNTVNGGSLGLTGNVNAAGGFFQTSDARKKDFGSNVEIDFNALKSIPKKYFEWKDNPEAGQQIGTSAQDLLRVYPSLVNKDKNGYYSVDYARLSIVALAAIDKLNNKIEELENKIESLERR